MDPSIFLTDGVITTTRGTIAEQLVGQELLAAADPHHDTTLYFWKRPVTGSEAEIDYVVPIGQHIFPIEVKVVTTGRLKSLRQFMEQKKSTLGIKISEDPLSFSQGILSVPFYLVNQLLPIVKTTMNAHAAP